MLIRRNARFPGMDQFPGVRAAQASIFDLLNAVNVVLQRISHRPEQRDIFEDKWSVSEKIQHLMQRMSERPSIKFTELFAGAARRGVASP